MNESTTMPRAHHTMPRAHQLDSTIALVRQGYDFVSNQCNELGSDVFRTRVLAQRTIFLRGRAAAELFYDEVLFTRKHAAPLRMQATLLGRGSVQSLDGAAHRLRKSMLLDLMTKERIADLTLGFEQEWERALPAWADNREIVLRDEVPRLLTRAVCAWAGVPLAEADVSKRTSDLVALYESPAALGPRHWRGIFARQRSERWLAGLIERERRVPRSLGSALGRVATYRDLTGAVLPARVAAVELLNVLRPTVAVTRFVVFAALALHEHPSAELDDEECLHAFVQEVRRFYPFFPTAVARVRKTFQWDGMTFDRGARAMLDLYGTNHDARSWPDPDRFDPERFRGWKGDPFSFIAQGGGDHSTGHRCAGEWLTIALMKSAVRMLRAATYEVPPQDLSISHATMPAGPKSGFRMASIHAA